MKSLSRQRQKHAMKYVHDHDRRLCIAAYLLLKKALRDEYGLEISPQLVYGPYGKPELEGYPHIKFNISHCHEAAVCVVSDEDVGVDVETLIPYDEDLVNTTMNESEKLFIMQSSNPSLALTRLWTMKESLLKLTGYGISDNIRDVLKDEDQYTFITQDHSNHNFIITVCQYKKA